MIAAKLIWKLAPGQRFGPEQQHDERADRDQAQGQRLAAQRDAGEDEQGGDAGAHGRHLGAGQQGVGDAGERAGAGRDQDQAEAQRQRRAQREQLQGQQHHRADHRGQVEPADREQMGEARAAHRLGVRLGDAELVAGGERGGDAALGAAAEPLADMSRQALAPVGDARAASPAREAGATRAMSSARPVPPIRWNQAARAKS